jgi:uncharacterized delta-60 repeat protein
MRRSNRTHAKSSLSLLPARRRRSRLRLESLESRICLSGGLLDPSFNGTGIELQSAMSGSSATAIDWSGRMVAVGSAPVNGVQEIVVMRLNPNGPLDTTFNSSGVVNIKVAKQAYGGGVAIQTDGKILVGGQAYSTPIIGGSIDSEFVVARLNTDGSLDRSFAKNGLFTWNPTPYRDTVTQVAVLSNGNIVATGDTYLHGDSFGAFMLTPSGSLVTGFGNSGLAAIHVGTSGDGIGGSTIAPNGDIVMVGDSYESTQMGCIVALTASGQLDTGFNGTGIVEVAAPTAGFTIMAFSSVVAQGSQLVVAGSERDQVNPPPPLWVHENGAVARYSLAGALDTSFGTGGYFTTSSALLFRAIALESDGSIVVGGNQSYQASDGTYHDEMAVAHLTANGVADTTFGTLGTGFAYVQIGRASDLSGLAIDGSDKIFICGGGGDGISKGQSAFARLTSPLSPSHPPIRASGVSGVGFADTATGRDNVFRWVAVDKSDGVLRIGTSQSPHVRRQSVFIRRPAP